MCPFTKRSETPLLSIAIPTYNRCAELDYSLRRLIGQCERYGEGRVEIQVADDGSTDGTGDMVRAWARTCPHIQYRRHETNIGLERNLIECARHSRGEYLWIFGDDDFLESEDALDVVLGHVRPMNYDVLVLNRTRRSFDLSRLLTPNWMRVDERNDEEFPGLREFCLRWGFISIIGFITVNVFRREPFLAAEHPAYYDTMYPQLGMMVEAFARGAVRFLARPLICHRTQTQEEKRAALGHKATEKDFMSDVDRRNAIYFCFPLIRMLNRLVQQGAFRRDDVVALREHTVINGYLMDFLLNNIDLVFRLNIPVEREAWDMAFKFFAALPLTEQHRERWALQYTKAGAMTC